MHQPQAANNGAQTGRRSTIGDRGKRLAVPSLGAQGEQVLKEQAVNEHLCDPWSRRQRHDVTLSEAVLLCGDEARAVHAVLTYDEFMGGCHTELPAATAWSVRCADGPQYQEVI